MSIRYFSSSWFGTSMAQRIADWISEERSEEHVEEHLEKVHSEMAEKTHLDVMSIRTMLDTRRTINQEVDWSSPSEERSTGD